MSKFDYVVLGGGCAGLSLAYELEQSGRLQDRRLAVVEPRQTYERDKTWSFWRTQAHRFGDCVVKRWDKFCVKNGTSRRSVSCEKTPYETVDSGLFYDKVLSALERSGRVSFFPSADGLDLDGSLIFNSVPQADYATDTLWQHFKGIEVLAPRGTFNPEELTLMDFSCEQRGEVHFFYVLPFASDRALVETTWISGRNPNTEDYDAQLSDYLRKEYGLTEYGIEFTERGAIPLCEPRPSRAENVIDIGGAGGMIRQSTGYAFLNIQAHSRHLASRINELPSRTKFQISRRYRTLDKIFLKVLKEQPYLMPSIFERFFTGNPNAAIPFLSNCGNLRGDFTMVMTMPKRPFLRAWVGW